MTKSGKKGRQQKKPALLLKTCSRCYKTKEITEFYHDSSREDGLSTKCKKCESDSRKLRRQKLQKRSPDKIPDITSKTCSKCGEVKPVMEFYRSLRNNDGYYNPCKACCLKQKQSYHRKLAARSQNQIPSTKTKRCPKCDEVKPVSKFYKAINKFDGYRAICKKCDNSNAVKYRHKIANREFEDIKPKGEKRCYMCKRSLPVGKFNYSRSSNDGLASHCRECGKKYKKQHYEQHFGEFYNQQVGYRHTHPERRKAFYTVHEATYKGKLIRPETCSKCGEKGYIVAHHNDYDKPLDVIWLCLRCDRQLHADLRRKEKEKSPI